MEIQKIQEQGVPVALVHCQEACVTDGQTALDFMMNVNYQTDSRAILLNKEALGENFFVLSTGVAGEILQKFVNYRFRLAIVGDFSGYNSKPLRDFIYESNQGSDIFFVPTREEGIRRLARAELGQR